MARSNARIRDYSWTGLRGVLLSIASNAAALVDVASVAVAATLMRTRGQLLAQIDGPVDGDANAVALGIIIVTEEQIAGGASTVPSPTFDLDAEWLWHGYMLLSAQAGTGVGASLNVGSVVDRLVVDSKAMRRMKQSQHVALAVESNSLSGTGLLNVFGAFRVLFGT